jgi:signal peptidase I
MELPNGMPRTLVVGPSSATLPSRAHSPEHPPIKDAFREVVETIVFVIVLVLLLKTFVAEAFVIPTGSMAETLLGYQRWVTCSQCGHQYPVNCSSEVDPQQGPPVDVLGCTCPNCRYREVWKERDRINGRTRVLKEPPSWGSGDRVLVSKFPYDNGHLGQPKRFDVVVFKYPEGPQKATTPMNYIKRLMGLPGETIGIFNGDIYVCHDIDYPPETHPKAPRPEDWWHTDYVYLNDEAAIAAWRAGKFTILRKPPDIMMAMRRIVFDNDHQAVDLLGKVPPRWQINGKSWSPDQPEAPKTFKQNGTSGAEIDWLTYQHLLVDRSSTEPVPVVVNPQPQLIRNTMGYNSGKDIDHDGRGDNHWVGDLMLECSVQVDAPAGELVLELSKGADRFHARFDLANGTVTLARVGTPEPLAKKEGVGPTSGTHALRFANFDNRLTLWIDGKLTFGDGVEYEAAAPQQDHPNNKEPARIGVCGGAKLSVRHVQLWRDTFYTQHPEFQVADGVQTRYVQPGHFLCMGDNSSESSDSRFWGLVPQRLLLGRALLVYYPFTRAGVIR